MVMTEFSTLATAPEVTESMDPAKLQTKVVETFTNVWGRNRSSPLSWRSGFKLMPQT